MKSRLCLGDRNHRKTVVIALILAFVALGGWYAVRWVRHARLDLVTLDVQNVPLSRVVKALERQTRERIVLGQGLEIPVSLQVRATPLAEVLDLLAAQAGAFWRATHAVHQSPPAFGRLASLVAAGNDPLQVGWTNLASPGHGPGPDSWAISGGGIGGDGPDVEAIAGGDARLEALSGAGPGTPVPQRIPLPPELGRRLVQGPRGAAPRVESGPNGPVLDAGTEASDLVPDGSPRTVDVRLQGGSERVTVVLRDGAGDSKTIDLSPERLLIEDRLARPGLLVRSDESLAEAAARLATQVRGRHGILYSLEPSPVPGFPGKAHRMIRTMDARAARGEGGAVGGPPGVPTDIEADVRRHQYDRLSRLSPEQRARRSRTESLPPAAP